MDHALYDSCHDTHLLCEGKARVRNQGQGAWGRELGAWSLSYNVVRDWKFELETRMFV